MEKRSGEIEFLYNFYASFNLELGKGIRGRVVVGGWGRVNQRLFWFLVADTRPGSDKMFGCLQAGFFSGFLPTIKLYNFQKFLSYSKLRSMKMSFLISLALQLFRNIEKPNFDIPMKRSFLLYFQSEFFIYLSLLPTKIASCLRAMLACSGTLSYPAERHSKV